MVFYSITGSISIRPDWSNIEVNVLKAGTPISIQGRIANDGTAVGLVAANTARNAEAINVVTAGVADLGEAANSFGSPLDEECLAALQNITFIYAGQIVIPPMPHELPTVTPDDNGKVATVVDGKWNKRTPNVGTPLIAETAADMDDTTKIYVYAGDEEGYTFGHWYYYADEAWTDGGEYGSMAVDNTLSQSGMAADAKATGDAISNVNDIAEDIEAVVFSNTVLDWSSIGNSTYPYGFRSGYYDTTDGSPKSSSHYFRSAKKVTFDCEVVEVTAPEGYSFSIIEYNGSTFVKTLCLYGVYTNPTSGTTHFRFNPVAGHSYSFTLSGWESVPALTAQLVAGWVVNQYNSEIKRLDMKIDKAKSFTVKYESGSYASGAATERVSVFLPVSSGYLMYRLYHFEDADNNCDGWQIYHVYHVDDLAASNQTDLTITGEWECAVHLDGRDDFSGGHTHGDEAMSAATFLLDGIPTDITGLTSNTECNEFKLIQTSTLYDPADNTTAIALHGKEYVFTRDELTLHQSLKWLVAEDLTNCFMAMFPPNKDCIDRAAANSDFEVLTLASAANEPLTTVTKYNADAVDMWDTTAKFSARISVPVYPHGLTGGDLATISDNSGAGDYNKLYFKICGGGSSAVNELWKTTTIYNLDFKEAE